MIEPGLTAEETLELVTAELERRKRFDRVKLGMLCLVFFFVVATTIGIQLSERNEGRARDAQLVTIEAQNDKLERLLRFVAEVDSEEAQQRTVTMLNQLLATADCNTRQALTEQAEQAGWVRPGQLSLACVDPPGPLSDN